MAYNPYGVPPYGPPPTYSPFPGVVGAPPGMAPPGLGPPPGMSSAPGLAPPPGVQQSNIGAQANRPSGIPASFQPPPNINFNAPVIRLGSTAPVAKSSTPTQGRKETESFSTARPNLGQERTLEQSRQQVRDSMAALVPPTHEERLRTIFIHKVPKGVGGDESIEKLLGTVGRLRRWDSAESQLSDHKGEVFGFAQYEDAESIANAVELLRDLEVPLKKQEPSDGPVPENEDELSTGDIEKVKLQTVVDANTVKYIESYQETRGEDPDADARLTSARTALKQFIRELFYPRLSKPKDSDGDTTMGGGGEGGSNENVEVVNIPISVDDELADIPAEMREVVAQEIAAFRERSIRRDMERLKREEEMEEAERQRNGLPRPSRLDSPPPGAAGGSNQIPLGPRGVQNAPLGPRGQSGRIDFVNGGTTNGHGLSREEEDTDASDEELNRRTIAKQKAEDDKLYLEAERKWVNRERQRAAALERERERDKAEADGFGRRREEQLEREKNWDDEKEAARKNHLYYRDHAAWIRKRAVERAEEEARDELDRRAEEDEQRRHEAEMEQARGMADSFLERQARDMDRRQAAAPAAPQKVTISFGAAAKAQAQRGPQRRTVAEVEGLLDDEEQDATVKRQLVPIKFEPVDTTRAMSEEEVQKAVRALAQEIPTEREGLWAWDVKWDFLEDSVIREKLRPFVEKKVMEYLGVQEQLLVDLVEEHLRKHQKPAELVETLAQAALDEDAEDLVKKLWRMVIFFTESEKRGLPA